MPVTKLIAIDRLPALLLGSILCGGGLAHMWFHAEWGTVDWGVIAIIGLGAGIMFNREVVGLIRAWKGRGGDTGEHQGEPPK